MPAARAEYLYGLFTPPLCAVELFSPTLGVEVMKTRPPVASAPAFPLDSVRQPQHPSPLRVTVVSTTIPATLAALRRAGEFAHELGAHIRIVIPHVVPYPLPLDRPPTPLDFKARHFRTLCPDGAVETSIDVRLCRDAYEAVAQSLTPESLVIIGGEKRWWFSEEHRLARKLTQAGHHVLVVPAA
jgi:hypothetical protein